MKKTLIFILIVILILLIPLIFKEKNNRIVIGPKLKDVSYTDVSFSNKYDNTSLGGMFFSPNRKDSFPVIVIIQGSGASRRSNSWYLSMAKYLQDNGIGVLIPDKRGSEKSKGDWVGASLETLATDTESAIDFLKNDSTLNFSKIGILGGSQGGWIAPIVVSKRQDISFVINISSAMVLTDEQLLFEEENNISPYTYNFIAKLISPITTNNLKKRESIAAFMGFDPVSYWKKVNIPVFIAYGENDKNCPVEQSLKKINDQNLNHFITQVYPNGGHGILDIKTNMLNSNFLNDMKNFIIVNKIDVELLTE